MAGIDHMESTIMNVRPTTSLNSLRDQAAPCAQSQVQTHGWLLRLSGPIIALLAVVSLCSGCRTPGIYRPGQISDYHVAPELEAITQTQFERGSRRPIIDGVGWVIGIPSKILMWDRRTDNHNISEETQARLAEYLAVNNLRAVKVRVNQYAPRDEWRRLVANKSVGPGWRYTLGTLSWVGYTVFPGRIFGGDNYNPFTNTINLYSDVPAFAVHEGGHAKDFAQRDLPGTYAAAYILLPVVPLYHEAVASRDALAYAHEFWPIEDERQAYRNLGPAYGSYVGGALPISTDAPLVVAGILGGHVIGRMAAARLPYRSDPTVVPAWEEPLEGSSAMGSTERAAEHHGVPESLQNQPWR